MPEEMIQQDPNLAPEMMGEEAMGDDEGQTVEQIIQLIASLSAESQRELMNFLAEEFAQTMDEDYESYSESPEEMERKADVMSDAF